MNRALCIAATVFVLAGCSRDELAERAKRDFEQSNRPGDFVKASVHRVDEQHATVHVQYSATTGTQLPREPRRHAFDFEYVRSGGGWELVGQRSTAPR
jgi:hypothetical protein